MRPEMRSSLDEMALSLGKVLKELDAEINEMERAGAPPSKIKHVHAGAKAIKDCANMLLVWSDYIASGDLADPVENSEVGPDPYPR